MKIFAFSSRLLGKIHTLPAFPALFKGLWLLFFFFLFKFNLIYTLDIFWVTFIRGDFFLQFFKKILSVDPFSLFMDFLKRELRKWIKRDGR